MAFLAVEVFESTLEQQDKGTLNRLLLKDVEFVNPSLLCMLTLQSG